MLVPLTYTGSVLALILAAGASSGVGIVLLGPAVSHVAVNSSESTCTAEIQTVGPLPEGEQPPG